MSPPPLVSVVVAVFNAAETLGQTLDNLLLQTYANLEIIVIDDGSTDASPAVLRQYEGRIRTVRQPNGGLPAARNTGCKLAKGEFVVLMDADDFCAPDRVAIQVRALQHYPEAVICDSDFSAFRGGAHVSPSYGGVYYSEIGRHPDGLASKYRRRDVHDWRASSPEPHGTPAEVVTLVGNVYPELAFGNFIHPPTVMFRRDALYEAGLFDETIRYNCDWECFIRVSRLGPVVHVCLPLLHYRLADEQMSGKGGKLKIDIVTTFEKVCRKNPILEEQHSARVLERRRAFASVAASELVEYDRMQAMRMLVRRIRLGGVRTDVALTIAKCVMPRSLVLLWRWLKASSGARAGAHST